QAEDGIRDKLVTGVQTCALPIWPAYSWNPARWASSWNMRTVSRENSSSDRPTDESFASSSSGTVTMSAPAASAWKMLSTSRQLRSEERRVGKEGGWQWCRDR